MENNAIKISDYPLIPVNNTHWTGKIENNAFILGYMNENYGPKYIRKNYQIPLSYLRSDILRYLGITNVRPSYRNMTKIWSGIWNNSHKALSYIYEWKDYENGDPDYIFNKFGERVEDDNFKSFRYFILKKAPLPQEQTTKRYGEERFGQDPYPSTMKLVDKAYIDGRFDGWRIVSNAWDESKTFQGNELKVRAYTCMYYIDDLLEADENGYYKLRFVLNDEQLDQRGDLSKTVKDQDKFVTFYVRVKKHKEYWNPVYDDDSHKEIDPGHNLRLQFLIDDKPVEWTYKDELNEIFRQETQSEYAYLKFHLYYTDDVLHIVGGAMFNRGQAYPRLRERRFDDNSTRNIKLIDFRGDSFISEYYDYDELMSKIESGGDSPMQTISFDDSGMECEAEYTWNYYLVTPYWTGIDENGYSNWRYFRDLYIQFENVEWTEQDYMHMGPNLEPNRLYCLEFTRVLNGLLIGRIKWFVSLVKKKLNESGKIQFTFDISDVIDHEKYKEIVDYELDLTRFFSKYNDRGEINNYNFVIRWGDYITKSEVTGNNRDGFHIIEHIYGGETREFDSDKLSHIYHLGGLGGLIPECHTTIIDGQVYQTWSKQEDVLFDVEDGLPIIAKYMTEGGTFNITIEGECPYLEGNTAPEHDSITDTLTSCTIPASHVSPLKGARAIFKNCTKFKTFDGRAFKYCSEAEDMSEMFKNTRLEYIASYAFKNCTSLKNIESMFEGSQIRIIPSNLFENCTELENINSLFRRNAAIHTIPENLFDNCTKIKYANYAFKFMPTCYDIPFGLLKENVHTQLIEIREIFCNGFGETQDAWYFDKIDDITPHVYSPSSNQAVESRLPELWTWNRFADLGIEDTCYNYYGCNEAQNWDIIPYTWKNLLDRPQGYLYEDYETIYYINSTILPREYEFVENVYFDGLTYIEGLIQRANDHYAIDVKPFIPSSSNMAAGSCGTGRTAAGNDGMAYIYINSNTTTARCKVGNNAEVSGIPIPREHSVWRINYQGLDIGDTHVFDHAPKDGAYPWLFVGERDSSVKSLIGLFYGGFIKRNAKYVMRLIPCRHKENNTYHLYDQVSGSIIEPVTGELKKNPFE